MFLTVTLCISLTLLLLLYLKGIYNEQYWRKRGVTFYEKYRTCGPFLQYFVEKQSFFQILNDIYHTYKEQPAVGLGSLLNKALYVKDLQNIQHILQTDFHSFSHRGLPYSDEDILANNVLLIHGPKWKVIRQKLTPLFTAAKLKNMYYICDKSAQDFMEFLNQEPTRLKRNAYETLTLFSSAAMTAAIFGIGTKSTFESPFRKMAIESLRPTVLRNLKFTIGGISDALYRTLKLKQFEEYEKFFIGSIKHVIREREKDNVRRHDFIDMCVNLQKNGVMRDSDTGLEFEPTDEVLAAQAFFFILAGVEPAASAMFATVVELGRHPDILSKVHDEVDAVFEKYNNQMTYDAIGESRYLEYVLNESLRLYPPIGFLTRQCVHDTVLPVSNIPVEKGTKILTPIYEIHHDPSHFPNPELFDPDRFSREGEVNEATFMPFGKGNRFCIGARFARVQVLSGLMYLLKNYSVSTNVCKGGIKYKKEQVQLRLKNVDVEFIPRKK